MSQNANKPAAEWQNYSSKVPLRTLRFEKDDFKQLYRLVAGKQAETKAFIMKQLSQLPDETPEQFAARQEHVSGAFVVSVTIRGFNDKTFVGNQEDIFDRADLPAKIRDIYYSTETVPAAVLNIKPPDRIVIFLDFSKPPMFDLARLPTWPTPNESNFSVDGDNNSWCTSSAAALAEFFDNRGTDLNWLHVAGLYDLLLFVIGLPFGIWAAYRAALLAASLQKLPIIYDAVCVYAFFLAQFFFRFMFTYARWLFPKIEHAGQSKAFLHRAAWATLMLGILACFAWDVVKAIV